MSISFNHNPVLINQVKTLFLNSGAARIIDGTLGGAGHASAILQSLPDARLLGIDQDPVAINAATEKLSRFNQRATVVRGRFSDMYNIAKDNGWENVDGILLDLGVSSPQLDSPERGFSFRQDGPLDMRMNPNSTLTAAQILNEYPEKDLADILYNYGEERKSRQIARAVVARRAKQQWTNTADFASLVTAIVGREHQHGLPPATRSFQALRIEVNDELGELKRGLEAAMKILAVGGIIVVISFHSLEDRIVKQFFNLQAATCVCPPGLPICTCGKIKTLDILTKKPVVPDEQEVLSNPRSSCSKLRAAKRIA